MVGAISAEPTWYSCNNHLLRSCRPHVRCTYTGLAHILILFIATDFWIRLCKSVTMETVYYLYRGRAAEMCLVEVKRIQSRLHHC